MKKTLIIAAAALSLLGGTAASAQPAGYGHDRQDRHERDVRTDRSDRHDQGRHDWRRGERLSDNYRGSRYAVDYRSHHLRAPPRGYRWQQVDNNFVLTAIATGLIADVIANR